MVTEGEKRGGARHSMSISMMKTDSLLRLESIQRSLFCELVRGAVNRWLNICEWTQSRNAVRPFSRRFHSARRPECRRSTLCGHHLFAWTKELKRTRAPPLSPLRFSVLTSACFYFYCAPFKRLVKWRRDCMYRSGTGKRKTKLVFMALLHDGVAFRNTSRRKKVFYIYFS